MARHTVLLALLILVSSGWLVETRAQPTQGQSWQSEEAAARAGKRLYRRKCVFCHGSNGEGDGAVSRYVFPRPRDLSLGLYKIHSTPTGGLPTDQDLFDTLTRGMPGTTMPSWANLTEADRWNLVAYTKTLSDRFATEGRSVPISIGEPKLAYSESVANGRRLYLDAECWECHGILGKGDGPSSMTLTDDWNYPIVPADLTVSRNWRGGSRPRDIFRSISVGIGGTPMPSWGEALTEDQIWDLTNYLFSIILQ